ncbi:DUF1835 domain-containing protein [Salegentibacter sp. F188]|uniref:DUF1835 domain-containing protein n=1 Tax=Autumnicola patrickiae TaxID=3075591 RepID=A0ABU3E2M5_9FLAO|nr:DUF1835 domain-containing protein [Salegentibacter sp. F188]MDT0690175.1 DUF1835 domain-containing protein [Salegentibacter sp. F188]
MSSKTIHITNGDGLAGKMLELDIPGEVIVWRELLCEGPTVQDVGGKEFVKLRKKFVSGTYGISPEDYKKKFVSQLEKLRKLKDYEEVILWFEFDLFCHINMIAVISFFLQHKKEVPMYLVCSKKLKGEKGHNPLTQLNAKQLYNHYQNKIPLTSDDLQTANFIWELYCSNNPLQLKAQIKKHSNFEYLSSCIRAHIERFPNSKTGINSLERNILNIIQRNMISSENQLLGYALEYQGYYGYSDNQMQRLLAKIRDFYLVENDRVILSKKGDAVMEGTKNFYRELNNNECLGGAKMYDFLYESESHRLLKL